MAAAAICVGCVNTIRYEYDLNDGKITILAQLSTADTLHSVILSMSYPDRIDSLSGATVNCYVNGTLHRASQGPVEYYDDYDWETGEAILVPYKNRYTRYYFTAVFKSGDEVRIEASYGGSEAWAEVVVPQPGAIVSVDTVTVVKTYSAKYYDGEETYEQEYVEFTVKLEDVKGADSFYSMNGEMTTVTTLTSEGEGMNGVFVQGPGTMYFETFHDQILEDGYSSGLGDLFDDITPVNAMHCFSDKLFRDGEATVRLYFPSYNFSVYPYHYDADEIVVNKLFSMRLKSFDRSFYNYLRALNNFDYYGYDVSPIVEPTMLPNNVTGGMGMASVAAESYYDIQLPPQRFTRDDFIYYY